MWRRHLTALVVIPIACACIYVPHLRYEELEGHPFVHGDGHYYFAMVVSLVDDGDLILNNNVPPTHSMRSGQLAYGPERDPARLVPKHPIVMAVIAAPFYEKWHIKGLQAFMVLVTSALVLALYFLLAEFVDRPTAIATAMLFAAATMIYRYTYLFYADTFSTLFMVLGVYFAVARKRELSALALGVAIFAKIPNAPLAALVSAYLMLDILREAYRRENGRLLFAVLRTVRFGVASALAQLPMLYANQVLYGSPFLTGYQRTARGGEIRDHTDEFGYPLMDGIERVLFDAGDGIVPTNPVLALSVLGLFLAPLHPRRLELGLVATLALAQVLFFAKYEDAMASPFSNRFLMGTVILCAVFAALLVARGKKWLQKRGAA